MIDRQLGSWQWTFYRRDERRIAEVKNMFQEAW